jgi:hypothetical protein
MRKNHLFNIAFMQNASSGVANSGLNINFGVLTFARSVLLRRVFFSGYNVPSLATPTVMTQLDLNTGILPAFTVANVSTLGQVFFWPLNKSATEGMGDYKFYEEDLRIPANTQFTLSAQGWASFAAGDTFWCTGSLHFEVDE